MMHFFLQPIHDLFRVMRFFLQTIHEWCGFFCNTPMMSSEWCGFFCQPPMSDVFFSATYPWPLPGDAVFSANHPWVMRFFLQHPHDVFWVMRFFLPTTHEWCGFFCNPPWCLLSDAVFSATPPWSLLSDVFFFPTPFECCGFFANHGGVMWFWFAMLKFQNSFKLPFAFSFQNHVNPNPGIQEQILQRKIDSTARYAYFGRSGKFRWPIGIAPKNVDLPPYPLGCASKNRFHCKFGVFLEASRGTRFFAQNAAPGSRGSPSPTFWLGHPVPCLDQDGPPTLAKCGISGMRSAAIQSCQLDLVWPVSDTGLQRGLDNIWGHDLKKTGNKHSFNIWAFCLVVEPFPAFLSKSEIALEAQRSTASFVTVWGREDTTKCKHGHRIRTIDNWGFFFWG